MIEVLVKAASLAHLRIGERLLSKFAGEGIYFSPPGDQKPDCNS
jgi:hypothetical protein